MASKVYYGSPRQSRLEAKETLPAKLDLIIDQLNLRERVNGETVAIKIHSGSNIGYSTVHPVFVRKVVK
ncbi:MAG: 4Fe-4S ferredoxin, partial [Anaerolineaceae bacterium]|nr:4Fe-4S ferredoxin [Anaerolineaceae bacterium]